MTFSIFRLSAAAMGAPRSGAAAAAAAAARAPSVPVQLGVDTPLCNHRCVITAVAPRDVSETCPISTG